MALGEQLRPEGIRHIIHSPLERAKETADIIATHLNPTPELQPDPQLTEAEFSRYLQGIPYWQVPLRRPLWLVHKVRRGIVPGDESIEAMGKRVLGVVRRLAIAHPGEAMALVSHADPLTSAWILLDGRPQNEREMHRKGLAKAGMLRLEMDGESPKSWEYVPPPRIEKPETAAA